MGCGSLGSMVPFIGFLFAAVNEFDGLPFDGVLIRPP